jgi:hypothetical protein
VRIHRDSLEALVPGRRAFNWPLWIAIAALVLALIAQL